MRRREFNVAMGGAAAGTLPLAAGAQQAKTARIGILNLQNPEPNLTLLREALRGLGYSEGKNLEFEFRTAEGNPGLLAGLAAELVRLKVDVIVAYPSPAVAIAKQATREIPIVMLGAGDPVGSGLVASLTRPGGNVTETSSTSAELGAKTLEVIREIIPSVRRVAVLANATDPFTKAFLEQMQLGGQALRVEIQIIMVKAADELDPALCGHEGRRRGCRHRPAESATKARRRSGAEISYSGPGPQRGVRRGRRTRRLCGESGGNGAEERVHHR
jgi:putative tryptophan/tyrosine transport system substrate-binding protein